MEKKPIILVLIKLLLIITVFLPSLSVAQNQDPVQEYIPNDIQIAETYRSMGMLNAFYRIQQSPFLKINYVPVVGICDVGIFGNDHPDIAGLVVYREDFVHEPPDPNLLFPPSHGIAMASLIGARGDNGVGICGVDGLYGQVAFADLIIAHSNGQVFCADVTAMALRVKELLQSGQLNLQALNLSFCLSDAPTAELRQALLDLKPYGLKIFTVACGGYPMAYAMEEEFKDFLIVTAPLTSTGWHPFAASGNFVTFAADGSGVPSLNSIGQVGESNNAISVGAPLALGSWLQTLNFLDGRPGVALWILKKATVKTDPRVINRVSAEGGIINLGNAWDVDIGQLLLPKITALNWNGSKKMIIKGKDFSSSPTIWINGKPVATQYVKKAGNTKIKIKGSSEQLGFKPGENLIQVFDTSFLPSDEFMLAL